MCPTSSLQPHNKIVAPCLRGKSIKSCDTNGTWKKVTIGGVPMERTNYEDCAFVGKERKLRELWMRISLYSLTLLFLLVASFVFISFKQYKNLRVQIHLNFFISLSINAICDMVFCILIQKPHLTDIGWNVILQK